MCPANQSFKANYTTASQFELWLIIEFELILFYGVAQLRFYLHLFLNGSADAFFVKLPLVFATFLSAVHGSVSITNQTGYIVACVREECHANAGCDIQFVIENFEWCSY